jgi:FtsZ-interacting cell division protein ZipA
LTGIELLNAFKHLELEINHEGYAEAADSPVAQYRIANMSRDGSLNEISDSQFYSYGIVCFYDASTLDLPLNCYELMLKKIDELVRLLELKVYNEDLQLLTLQHVTEIRERLKGFE